MFDINIRQYSPMLTRAIHYSCEIEDALDVREGGNVHFDDAVLMFEKALWWSRWWFPKPLAKARLQEANDIMIQRQ